MHIEFGEVAFVLAAFKELFMRQQDVLQLLDGIIFAASRKQHGKLTGDFDLIFDIHMRGVIERVAEIVDIGYEDIDDETTTRDKMVEE